MENQEAVGGRSSIEVVYRAMGKTVFEFILYMIEGFLGRAWCPVKVMTRMYYDNQVTIYIAPNRKFH